MTYIRTLMIFELRFKGEASGLKPVHVPSATVQDMLGDNYRTTLAGLVASGELAVYRKPLPNGRHKYYYEACRAGEVDFSLLPRKQLPTDATTMYMLECLKHATLPPTATPSAYWHAFRRWRDTRMDLFARYDGFGHRFHTPVTSTPRDTRPSLMLYGEPTASIDIVQSQPTILAHLLQTAIGDNEFSGWIGQGVDVYTMLQASAGLATRDEAKTAFFEIAFGKPSDKLAKTYGDAGWVRWINDIKRTPLKANPNTKYNKDGSTSHHNNLAMLLQRTEAAIMRKIWTALVEANIPFLTIHDEIAVRTKDLEASYKLMAGVIVEALPFAKISTKRATHTLITPKIGKPLSNGETVLYNQLNELYGQMPINTIATISGVDVLCIKRTISEIWEGYCISRGRSSNSVWQQYVRAVYDSFGLPANEIKSDLINSVII